MHLEPSAPTRHSSTKINHRLFHRSLILLLISTAFLIIAIGILFYLQQIKEVNVQTIEYEPLELDLEVPTKTAPEPTKQSLRQIGIANYEFQAGVEIPNLPGNLYLYEFKQNFNIDDALNLGQKMTQEPMEIVEVNRNEISLQNENNSFNFDLKSGTFSLISSNLTIPESTDTEVQSAQLLALFRNQLRGFDESIGLSAVYEKLDSPGVKFFEFRRDWTKVGLPIINPAAILTLPDDKKISDLTPNYYDQSDPEDTNIAVATDQALKARKNDFNTITVSVLTGGRIESIVSNMRLLEAVKPAINMSVNQINRTNLIQKLDAKETIFDLALPAGTGQIDLKKVFPDNKFTTDRGSIKEVTLIYLEKSPQHAQKYLQPAYLIRGEAQTDSGIRVKFSQIIPVIKDEEINSDLTQ